MGNDLAGYSHDYGLRLPLFSALVDYRFGYGAIRIASAAASNNIRRDDHDTVMKAQFKKSAMMAKTEN